MNTRVDRGGTGVLLLIAFVVIGLWVGYRIGRLYFDHSTLKNEVEAVADEALASVKGVDVQGKISGLLRLHDAQFDPEKMTVEYNEAGNRLTIVVPYTRYADLGVFRQPFSFTLDIQREAPKQAGILRSVQESVEDAGAASARKYQEAVKDAVGK